MVKKQMTDFEKGQAIAWRKAERSYRAIGNELNRSQATILNLVNNFMEKKVISRRIGSGRRRATTKREDRRMLLAQRSNWALSASAIRRDMNLKISDKTVSCEAKIERKRSSLILDYPQTIREQNKPYEEISLGKESSIMGYKKVEYSHLF
jgi:transposase